MGHAPQDPQGLALRARIVLASAEGRSNTAVAAWLGISRVTVIEWRARDLEEALGICRDLGNRRGPGNALIFLRIARRATRDYPAAAGDLEETLGICGDLGDRGGEAEALNEAGTPHRVAGDLRQGRRMSPASPGPDPPDRQLLG